MNTDLSSFPSDHVVLADQTHLRIYRAILPPGRGEDWHLMSALSLDYPRLPFAPSAAADTPAETVPARDAMEAAGREDDGAADTAPSSDPSPRERRLIRDIVSQINDFFRVHARVTWSFSAEPLLYQSVLASLDPGVRGRLQIALTKCLIGEPEAHVISEFCQERPAAYL